MLWIKRIALGGVCFIASPLISNPLDNQKLIGHLRKINSKYNQSVNILKEKGLSHLNSSLNFTLKEKDRNLFRGPEYFLKSDLMMGKIIFSRGQEVILVISASDLLQQKLISNGKIEFLNLESDFSQLQKQMKYPLEQNINSAAINSDTQIDAAASSLALYGKILYNYFKDKKASDYIQSRKPI